MPNPWTARRVLNYAHQGGAREGPSSTLAAMRRAVAAGAHALELDVHATADRQLVVCHDETVDRTTDGQGPIAELTLDELRRLDNAYWWVPGEVVAPGHPDGDYVARGRAPADRDYGIATVAEVLDAFPGVLLNFDIKQTSPDVEPYEAELAGLLRQRGRVDDVIVASFHDSATVAFSRAAPEIATSAGTTATAQWVQALLSGAPLPTGPYRALQVPTAYAGVPVVTAGSVAAAHEQGLAVHVWTIDEPEAMAELVALGVDGIMTDRPSVLAGVLAATGAAWRS